MNGKSGTLQVVYDNVSLRPGLQPDWGFACYIDLPDQKILFDTGADGPLLLENLKRLDLDRNAIEKVVISHAHGDHAGGLSALRASINHPITVFLTKSFPEQFVHHMEVSGARCESIKGPREISPSVHTTGEITGDIPEQALVLDAAEGLVVVTGCAHPGIVEIVELVKEQFNKKIRMLIGGFHLMYEGSSEVQNKAERLEALGVEQIAPGHCTGEEAIEIIHRRFKDRAGRCGVGFSMGFPI